MDFKQANVEKVSTNPALRNFKPAWSVLLQAVRPVQTSKAAFFQLAERDPSVI